MASVDTEATALLSIPEGSEDGSNNGSDSDRTSPDSQRSSSSSLLRYDWRDYIPKQSNRRLIPFLRWCIVGGASYAHQSDELIQANLRGLAHCLVLLRQYQIQYGMPYRGGPRDQELVLREVYTGLFAGGAPIWAISPVLEKVAEGLAGKRNVRWLLLPHKAFAQDPSTGATFMFSATRKFDFCRLDAVEAVAVRLCSFATNTRGPNMVPARLPDTKELAKAAKEGSVILGSGRHRYLDVSESDQMALATKILSLASKNTSLFFFANMQDDATEAVLGKTLSGVTFSSSPTPAGPTTPRERWARISLSNDGFWKVTENDRELFSRLATIEALQKLDRIHKKYRSLYPGWMWAMFRGLSSAGAAAFWFKGSWQDLGLTFLMALVVAYIETTKPLSRQERVVVEIIAGFVVGLSAGLVSLKFPNSTCFGAIALGAVLNILQGFRIVFAIVEILSRHTVAGSADLLEGMLFTGLIAYFLRFGQYTAAYIIQDPDETRFDQCHNGVNEWWYFLFVPVAALSWSGLFNPNYRDLPIMCFHGTLAVGISQGLAKADVNPNINNFVSSLVVSFCASVFSRFTGRQAIGSTVAAIYALVPGAYAVRSLLSTTTLDLSFFTEIVQRSVIIGLGAWSGSILCSPTVIGTTPGLISQQRASRDTAVDDEEKGSSMLFF